MKRPNLLLTLVLVALVGGCGSGGSGDEGAACAAAQLEPDLELDETLPTPVAETEVAILAAAVACDRDRLDMLADFELDDPPFTTIVELFEGPVVLDGDTYVWPGTEAGGPRTAIAADGTWQYFTPADPSVLAATDDGRLILLASDGTEQRELGAIAPNDATNGFAVSPDGRFAYFDRGGEPTCDAKVVRLNLETGRERTIATGAQPALSPDGRRLAYVTCRRESDFPDRLVVRRLKSGKERRIEPPDALLLALPSWAPDSRHLAIEVSNGTGEEIWVLDATADETRVVTLESVDNTFWAGYRGDTGEFYALTAPGGEGGAGSPLPVIAIDAETGRTLGTLFELDAQCCLIDLASDRSGTTILVAGTNAGLVVWREGEAAPSPVARGIRSAAWVPTGA
ncbi:MAG TPA: hypothetical protein VMQ81_00305 [Acidimicrobiia bacterium]|nr:hypothetical protein [Acidimicrobiia bacterium]